MNNEVNITLVKQAERLTQEAEQYLDIAIKNLQRAGMRLAMIQRKDESDEDLKLVSYKSDQVLATAGLVNKAHDGIGIAADFSELLPCVAPQAVRG